MGLYEGRLLQLPSVVVANKVDDLENPGQVMEEMKRRTSMPIVPVSAMHGVGLDRLKAALRLLTPTQPVEQLP